MLGVICTDWGDFGHYNLQGGCWLAFAWTAQQAWSGDTDARSFDRAFGRLLFGETRGATAACYYDKTVSLEQDMQRELRQRAQQDRFQRIVQQLLHLPQGVWGWAEDDTPVCRCECVTRARIQQAVSQGHTTMNGIKRNTRAGMGWCGGRMCMQNVAAYAAGGRPDPDLAPMTPRPLARPVSLQSLSRQESE